MAWGAIAGALAGAAGAFLDARNQRNAAADQRQFNEYAYRNRYQWQMEDMREAGLNPILSYKQGAPGVPGVGGYSSNVAGGIAGGVSSAVAAQRVNAEVDNIRADTKLKEEQQTVATTQHQLNDLLGRQQALRNMMLAPEAFSANQLMELFRSGSGAGETLAWINRLRRTLGIGSDRE